MYPEKYLEKLIKLANKWKGHAKDKKALQRAIKFI
jgi:hypothetical protein